MNILNNLQNEKYNFAFLKIKSQSNNKDRCIDNFRYYFENRKKIISVLIRLNNKLLFNRESLFLAIHFMDILGNIMYTNSSINFERVDFKKLAIVCTLISSKFTENDPNIPNVKDYITEENNYYSSRINEHVNEIKKLEVECLIILNHKLNYSTPYNFLKAFFAIGFFFEEDFEYFKLLENLKISSEISDKDHLLSLFIEKIKYIYQKCENYLMIIIQENEIFKFKSEFDSFRIISAIIYNARESFYGEIVNDNALKQKNIQLKKFNIWPQKMNLLFKIKFESFEEEYIFIKK